MKKLILIAALAMSGAAGVQAAPQTVTLDVPGMTCAACPITVKKAISKVDGVSKVDGHDRPAVGSQPIAYGNRLRTRGLTGSEWREASRRARTSRRCARYQSYEWQSIATFP